MLLAPVWRHRVLSPRTPVLQSDTHIAELSVRETLDFAARVQGVGHKRQVPLPPSPPLLPPRLPRPDLPCRPCKQ